MQYNQIPKLYEKRCYFESPLAELYIKLKGNVKSKKEFSLLGNLKNPGSLKRYFKFHHKGRVMVFYDECPPKEDSKPKTVVYMQEIKDVQANFGGKNGHVKVLFDDDSFVLKFDFPKEMDEWIKAVNFFRDFYKNEKIQCSRTYQEEIDIEASLKIMAENEIENWNLIKDKYDYSIFFKDKNLFELFTRFSIGQLANRVLVGWISKKTRWNKGDTVANSHFHNSKTSTVSKNSGISEISSPMSVNKRQNKTFFEKIDSLGFKNYMGLLISQATINQIDEESYPKDLKTINRPDFLKNLTFNTLYLFDYNGPGDIRPASKKIWVKSFKK